MPISASSPMRGLQDLRQAFVRRCPNVVRRPWAIVVGHIDTGATLEQELKDTDVGLWPRPGRASWRAAAAHNGFQQRQKRRLALMIRVSNLRLAVQQAPHHPHRAMRALARCVQRWIAAATLKNKKIWTTLDTARFHFVRSIISKIYYTVHDVERVFHIN